MTEIKILFTKKSIKNVPVKDLNPRSKGLELEIQSDFLMSQICSLKNAVGNPTDARKN